ncbi:uncharacterized protein LOC144548868 [Carex rostrata]
MGRKVDRITRYQYVSNLSNIVDVDDASFSDEVVTRLNRIERYDDGRFAKNDTQLLVVSYPRHATSSIPVRDLTDEELNAAHYYIMTNCRTKFDPFIEQFDAEIREKRSTISASGLDRIRSKEFGMWMHKLALSGKIGDPRIAEITRGPITRRVQCYNMYDVNSFRFHTESYGINKKITNYGVCVEGENWEGTSRDYFGILEEIIWLEYSGVNNKVFLFKCRWFDTHRGLLVDKEYGLVEINHTRLLQKDEHFVFPCQIMQVYYLPYASSKRERQEWWVTIKTKGKRKPLILFDEDAFVENTPHLTEFFQEDGPLTEFVVRATYELNDPSLFVDGVVPEIIEEQELQEKNQENISKKRKKKKRTLIGLLDMAPSRKGKGKALAEDEGESIERNVCGANAYKTPSLDLSSRPVLRLAGYKTPGETKDVTKIISQEVRNNYPSPYSRYTDFPKDNKDVIQAEFLHYQFTSDVAEREAWSTFRRIADVRLKDMLNKCKWAATKQYEDSKLSGSVGLLLAPTVNGSSHCTSSDLSIIGAATLFPVGASGMQKIGPMLKV